MNFSRWWLLLQAARQSYSAVKTNQMLSHHLVVGPAERIANRPTSPAWHCADWKFCALYNRYAQSLAPCSLFCENAQGQTCAQCQQAHPIFVEICWLTVGSCHLSCSSLHFLMPWPVAPASCHFLPPSSSHKEQQEVETLVQSGTIMCVVSIARFAAWSACLPLHHPESDSKLVLFPLPFTEEKAPLTRGDLAATQEGCFWSRSWPGQIEVTSLKAQGHVAVLTKRVTSSPLEVYNFAGKTRHFCKFQKDNSWPRNCGRLFPSCWSKRNMTDARGAIVQWGIGEPTPHARAEQNKIPWTRTATEKSKSEITSVLRLPGNPRRCIEDILTSSFIWQSIQSSKHCIPATHPLKALLPPHLLLPPGNSWTAGVSVLLANASSECGCDCVCRHKFVAYMRAHKYMQGHVQAKSR